MATKRLVEFGNSRERRPLLVALTGWGKDEDRHRSDDAGFDAHVVKPMNVAKLLADVGAARQGLRG